MPSFITNHFRQNLMFVLGLTLTKLYSETPMILTLCATCLIVFIPTPP